MSFYTALTGLKGAQTDISTTSNNIANVGSNGFKKSRAEFGDIYGSTPLQAKSVGVGTLTKSITQQFSQGNIATSSNSLDMAISGQGFFALQAGGNAQQTVYTRNGAFNVDDTGFIVDSNGQFLLGYPVDDDGAVSDKTLAGANKLQLKSEYGAPKQTGNIQWVLICRQIRPCCQRIISLMPMILILTLLIRQSPFLIVPATRSLQLYFI